MLTLRNIARLHFSLLIFLLFNFGLTKITGFGIMNSLAVVLKCILYLTGGFLFFTYLRPFRKAALYYFFYLATPIVLIIFYFAHGIFFGILSSLLLSPIMPIEPQYSDDQIKIYSKFDGLFGNCCAYYATRDRLYLFEEHQGTIATDEVVNFENSKVVLKNDSLYIHEKVYPVKFN